MTNPNTSSILLDDYSSTGAVLNATNLAINPGFESSGATITRINYYRYPSAAQGTGVGWDNGFGSNVNPLVVSDTTFPGGKAYTRTVSSLTGTVMGTMYYSPNPPSNLQNTYLPAITGSATNRLGLYVKTSVPAGVALVVTETNPVTGAPVPGGFSALVASWTTSGATEFATGTYTLTDPANTVVVEVKTLASFTGEMRISGAIITPGTSVCPYFDGSYSPSPSVTVNWSGGGYQSISILSATFPDNTSAALYDSWALRSSDWQNHGLYSLELLPTTGNNVTAVVVAGNNVSLVGNGVTFIQGHTYTVKATLRLSAPQTGTLNAAARTLRVTYNGTGGTTASTAASANVAGTYTHTLTFTVPSNAGIAYVQLWNGSPTTPVWWDDLLIVDTTAGGAYVGGWFSGSSDAAQGTFLAWTGPAENSTSTLSTGGPQVKLAELESLSYDYAGISSPYADDTSLSLGVASFTTKSATNLKNWLGRVVWPRRNADNPRKSLVRDVSKANGLWSMSADTGATQLNYDYTFLPVLSNEAGITFTTVDGKAFRAIANTDSLIPSTVLPGYSGNGLAAIAQLAQAYGPTAFAVEDEPSSSYKIVNRSYGEANVFHVKNTTDWEGSFVRSEPARNIEVIWYEGGYGDNVEIVPTDADTISVDAGETFETDIETTAWLRNVNQPTCVEWVEADKDYYSGTSGVYAIAGNDNLPIPPAEWLANGGSVTVSIDPEDPRTLHVKVVGMVSTGSSASPGPYRIAMASDDAFYPALRVTADAVTAIPHTLKLPTGVDESITKTDVGVTIDNPFIQSLDQAYKVGVPLARKYCGVVLSLTGSGEGITPFMLLDNEWMRYIVRDISGDPSSVVTFNAESRTLMGDFQEVWPRATYSMSDFQNVWPRAKYTMGQFMLEELRNPLRDGTGVFLDQHDGTWASYSSLVADNGDGTWSSDVPIDNGDGTWTG